MIRFVEWFAGVGGFRRGIEACNGKQQGNANARGRDCSVISESQEPDQCTERRNYTCVGVCEIDRFARSVYARRFGHFPQWRDSTAVVTSDLPDFDMLCAGFPCQDFSIAGQRRGLEGTRGTLFFEVARIARDKQPRYLFLENVDGLLSDHGGETFYTILRTLDEVGYDLQWEVLNSRYWGVPQNRRRVFLIGHLRGTSRPQVFPLGEDDGVPETDGGEVLPCLSASDGKGPSKQLAALMVPVIQKMRSEVVTDRDDLAGTLYVGGHDVCQRVPIVPVMQRGPNGTMYEKADGVDNAIGTGCGSMASASCPIVMMPRQDGPGSRNGQTSNIIAVSEGPRFRRLTPRECERLQGFPDDWTAEGIDEKTGKVVKISDTQRYRMMGNAVTVSVIEAIARALGRGSYLRSTAA